MRDPRNGSVFRTLATFVIRLEPGSAPTVYAEIFNEGTPPETFAAKLDGNFWNPQNKQ